MSRPKPFIQFLRSCHKIIFLKLDKPFNQIVRECQNKIKEFFYLMIYLVENGKSTKSHSLLSPLIEIENASIPIAKFLRQLFH